MFTDSDFQTVGYDSSKFVNSTSTQFVSASNSETATLYRQEAKSYTVQILHYQGSFASSVFDNDLIIYQLFKPTVLKNNEYGDRSVRMKLTATNGVEGRILLIQKGNDELEFVYFLSDEVKINNLVQVVL